MPEIDIDEVLVGFGRYLRRRGLPVGTGRILTFCRGAAELAPLDRDRLYWAGRATLVAHPDHIAAYDRAFHAYFRAADFDEALRSLFRFGDTAALDEAVKDLSLTTGAEEAEAGHAEAETVGLIAAETDIARETSFEHLDEHERRVADRMIRALAVSLPARRSRRLERARRGAHFDLRRTVKASLRTQGEPLSRSWRARAERLRPLVLVLDVSGSMAPFARALMQFGFAAMGAGRRVEVFCFGTRLTRVTRALRTKDPDRALDDVAGTVQDWAGGTLIGASLEALIDRYRATAALRGAVVVVCSDGLERGNPDHLAHQVRRLSRLAHKIVWVNPLKGDPRYQPLARGMAAALPHIDVFLPGHNVASLEALAAALSS